MKFNIWLDPHMPTKEEIETGILYIPQSYLEDERLNYLDNEIYVSLCVKEQLDDSQYKNIDEIIAEIKTHPDKNEEILEEFFQVTGKTIETITDEEFDNLPKVPLTIQDVKESLNKLEQLGYIEKHD